MKYIDIVTNEEYLIPKNIIYIIKNIINGKVYIGQTVVPLKKRFIQHLTVSRPWTNVHKCYIHNSINKHGIDNFNIDILEYCKNRDELNDREIYWIKYYNSTNREFGYNIESGGMQNKKTTKLSEEHKLLLLKSNLGIERSINTKKKISESHKLLWNNKDYRDKHISNINNIAGYNSIPVYQVDLNNNIIKKWKSISDVSMILYRSKDSRLSRNINNNFKKGKIGFYKNGSYWTFIEPTKGGPHFR